ARLHLDGGRRGGVCERLDPVHRRWRVRDGCRDRELDPEAARARADRGARAVHVQVRDRGRGAGPAGLKVGILGGAFNPPHLGHLVLAQEAVSQLSLERLVWMPYGEPSHRVLDDDPGPEARFTMCEYAVGADARFAVSRMEIDRGGPVYTVDTLRELTARAGSSSGAGCAGTDLFLLLGGDQAASLPSWQAPEEVLSLALVAVVERDDW